MQVLAIDPGREKCGIALTRLDAGARGEAQVQVLARDIWPRAQFGERLKALLQEQEVQAFVLGDATSSRELRADLEREHANVPIHVVDERNSTLEARPLYWTAHPPRGWRRLLPLSLQNPPCAIDDFAAQVLAIRFAQSRSDV